jgi:hypothetical protein
MTYRHEICESSGLTAHSFGQEEVDRHVVAFKETPSDQELLAMRRGDEFDPTLVVAVATNDEEECSQVRSVKRKHLQQHQEPTASGDYLHKYEKHLGGSLRVAKDAARSTKADNHRAYGEGEFNW